MKLRYAICGCSVAVLHHSLWWVELPMNSRPVTVSTAASAFRLGLCPVHILAIGRTIVGDLKFHDMPRFACNVTANLYKRPLHHVCQLIPSCLLMGDDFLKGLISSLLAPLLGWRWSMGGGSMVAAGEAATSHSSSDDSMDIKSARVSVAEAFCTNLTGKLAG